MQHYRFNNKYVFYYTIPWDGFFYKNSKFEQISISEFKSITNMDFQQFYDKKINVTNNKSYSLTEYMQQYLELEQKSVPYCDALLRKLSINVKYMHYNKVLDLIVEKNICKPIFDLYEISCSKKCKRLFEMYETTEKKTGVYEVYIPRYKCLTILNSLIHMDKFVKYNIIQ